MHPLASLMGPDLLVVVAVIALLFGGSQVPKLARSLGSAKTEFERGISESADAGPDPSSEHRRPDPATREASGRLSAE